MSSITNLRRLCVYACTLRGRAVEIIYGDDHRRPAIIVDENTREVLRWKLTPAERRDLGEVITGHYQLGGTESE